MLKRNMIARQVRRRHLSMWRQPPSQVSIDRRALLRFVPTLSHSAHPMMPGRDIQLRMQSDPQICHNHHSQTGLRSPNRSRLSNQPTSGHPPPWNSPSPPTAFRQPVRTMPRRLGLPDVPLLGSAAHVAPVASRIPFQPLPSEPEKASRDPQPRRDPAGNDGSTSHVAATSSCEAEHRSACTRTTESRQEHFHPLHYKDIFSLYGPGSYLGKWDMI
jgi:hypothetical protein